MLLKVHHFLIYVDRHLMTEDYRFLNCDVDNPSLRQPYNSAHYSTKT